VSLDKIWAPWRLAYIVSNKDQPKPEKTEDGCFLCRYAAHPERDAEHHVVTRGKATLTVLNRFPYNNGHLLVAPIAHKANLTDLDDAELLELQHDLQRMIRLLDKMLTPQGYNIGLNLGQIAGAGLPGHLHWHVVPRWSGDTNFMPVLANINVVPQSLEALHELLVTERS
jgi:ATP adenylyltransferase